MANIGLWSPFINQTETFSWYELPSTMQRELARYRPDGCEMQALSQSDYARLHRSTVAFTDKSVAPFQPAYHHAGHFRKVEALGLEAADAYAATGRGKMPPLVRQAFGLALYAHDAHHCASTFRSQAPGGIYRPQLGTNLSSEWVTSLSFNQLMQRAGLNFPTRLFQTSVIWSSTYGGDKPLGQKLGLPTPQPSTIWGAIMRAADVCPPASFEQWLVGNCAVNYGEIPAESAPRTIAGLIVSSHGFMSYISSCFDRMDEHAGAPLSARLGWRLRLDTMQRGLAVLGTGKGPLVQLLHKETSRYGVTLT